MVKQAAADKVVPELATYGGQFGQTSLSKADEDHLKGDGEGGAGCCLRGTGAAALLAVTRGGRGGLAGSSVRRRLCPDQGEREDRDARDQSRKQDRAEALDLQLGELPAQPGEQPPDERVL